MITNYIWNNTTRQVLRIDSEGRMAQVINTCDGCNLLLLGDNLYIVHYNGTVIETRVSDGDILSISTIPNVDRVRHYGSLSSKSDRIPDKQTLLLSDEGKGEVFTFNPTTGQKKVRITGLSSPASVSYFFLNHIVYYIVCEAGRSTINIYDNTWGRIRTISAMDSKDQKLAYPLAAVVTEEGTIIVSDFTEHRVSEFSFNGTFLRHLLVQSDGIGFPQSMSYYYPNLWLIHGGKLNRYNLYRSVIIYLLLS